ncbi:MAG: hypothetical protein RDV00_04125 [Clostridia bacterium]|nr:hypothetical protein [Clostridia bacterium]
MLVAIICLAILAGGCAVARDGEGISYRAPSSGPRWELNREDGKLALRRGDEYRLILGEAARGGFELPSTDGRRVLVVLEFFDGQTVASNQRRVFGVDLVAGSWSEWTRPELACGELAGFWSPDGRHIALADQTPVDSGLNLVLVDADTGRATVLVKDNEAYREYSQEDLVGWIPGFHLLWAGDGGRLVYSHRSDFYVVDLRDQIPRLLAADVPLFQHFLFWDGRTLVYQAGDWSYDFHWSQKQQVRVFELEQRNHYPLFTPDPGLLSVEAFKAGFGRTVYLERMVPAVVTGDIDYHGPVRNTLYRIDLDTGDRKVLWQTGFDTPALMGPVAVSPDGRRLAFSDGDEFNVIDTQFGGGSFGTTEGDYAKSRHYRWVNEHVLEIQSPGSTIHTLDLRKPPGPPRRAAEVIRGMFFPENLIGFLFWPAILIAVVSSVYGIARRRSLWLLLGALLTMPTALYLLGTPRFRNVAVFLPLFLVLAALAMSRQRPWLALALLAPYAAFFGWLAWLIFTSYM